MYLFSDVSAHSLWSHAYKSFMYYLFFIAFSLIGKIHLLQPAMWDEHTDFEKAFQMEGIKCLHFIKGNSIALRWYIVVPLVTVYDLYTSDHVVSLLCG